MEMGFKIACIGFLLISVYPEKSYSCFSLLAKLTEEITHSIEEIGHGFHDLFLDHGTPPPRSNSPTLPAVTTPVHTTTAVSSTWQSTTAPTSALYTATVQGPVTGVVCYSCTGMAGDGSCSAVALCKANEVCAVFKDPSGYTHKCLDSNVCSAAKAIVPDRCWRCCSGSLCNQRCSADSCVDTANCDVMKQAGFSVCSDPKLSRTDCKKSCNNCSGVTK